MSLLNIGLQNCALARISSDSEESEKEFKKAGSMRDLRRKAEGDAALKEKWQKCIEPVTEVLKSRFQRLALKGEPFVCLHPACDGEIEIFQRHIKEMFPTLDPGKLQKIHTQKSRAYTDWVDKHCRSRQYTFQIRKCHDSN
jgi:hypothetical protein